MVCCFIYVSTSIYGAKYWTDPKKEKDIADYFARPKSDILEFPSLDNKTFADFKSRNKIFLEWIYYNASPICAAYIFAYYSDNFPF